jgi:tetratricopeptide (TPR) repeat protein
MKSLRSHLTVTVMVIPFTFAVLTLSILSGCAKKQEAQQEVDRVVPDTIPSQVEPTDYILKISGDDNYNVFLKSLDIKINVIGNIASTRYTIDVMNDSYRDLEGVLTFPWPAGRSVSYYALDINGKMREAVPMERARGTEVFEAIKRRRVDPGLLEWVDDDTFRSRVFPIQAHGGKRRIVIGYEEELTLENDSLRYRLPSIYTGPLGRFSVKAVVLKDDLKSIVHDSVGGLHFDKTSENYVASFVGGYYRPISFALPAPIDTPLITMQSTNDGYYYFLASVAPKLDPRKKEWNNSLAIIWDVSLSATRRNLERDLELLNIIFTEKKYAKVYLYFLNNKLKKILNKDTNSGEYIVRNGRWEELKIALRTATFDGGTDFSQINLNDIAGNEILFFSDGISTLSDADFVKDTKPDRPVHCISSAKVYGAMKIIAGKTHGKFLNINTMSSKKLKEELFNETPLFLGAEYGKSVREAYPSAVSPILNGNFSLSGISDRNNAELTLLFGFRDTVVKRIKVKLDAKNIRGNVDVRKLWAQKKITELELYHEKNRDELIELGRQFGIVTRNTSLMVLETLDDYINYNIEPPATEPKLYAEYQRRMKNLEEQEPQNGILSTVTNSRNAVNMDGMNKSSERLTAGNRAAVPRENKSLTAADVGKGATTKRNGNHKTRVATDFFEKLPEERIGTLVPAEDVGMRNNDDAPMARATQMGVLGIVSGQIKGKSVASADVFSKGGLWNIDMDAIILSVDGHRIKKSPFVTTDIDTVLSAKGIAKNRNLDTLNRAPAAAEYLKIWWNTHFTPAKPAPNEKDSLFSDTGTGFVKGGLSKGSLIKTNDYMYKLTGETTKDYQIYLDERKRHANIYASGPDFYFDMANWFYAHGDKETAIRILTSVADLELENALTYRLLGYRLKEYGEYAPEKFICKKVIELRPIEPQSYRDYANALADNGEEQAALDSLYSILTKEYPKITNERNRGIVEVIVTEINRLIAQNANLNKSKIYKPLLTDIPVDIRVVINWNTSDIDIDLQVKDPNNEWCYDHNRQTSGGGRISADVRDGYGPEQFIIKKAIPGKYKVFVNHYSGYKYVTTDVMAEIYTKYADKAEQRKVVCLQIPYARKLDGGNVLVTEFDF